MITRREKNAQRKLQLKERKNAIATSLRSQPLRPINTRGLQILQQALGLPLDPCSLPREQTQVDIFEPDGLDKEVDSTATLLNVPVVLCDEGTIVAMPEHTIPILQDFGSQEPELLDVLFIAIDFEYSHYSPKTGRIRLIEAGISTFDTRDLRHQNVHLGNVITTQHYRTVKDTKKFLFGETIDISQDELVLILKRLLYLEDAPRQNRDLILIGHGFGFEIKAMKGLGIDLNLAPSIVQIFDTEFLAYEVFGRDFKSSLSNVVQKTGIAGGYFHNAGNDANFSFRAMLLLAIYRFDTLNKDKALQSKLEAYRKLAQV